MTIVFPGLLLIAGLLCWPALLYARGKGAESYWLLFAGAPATGIWLLLTALGFGAQSLSNLVEVPVILSASVVLAYMKVFLTDGRMGTAPRSTYLLVILLAVLAIMLRAFMPLLPE